MRWQNHSNICSYCPSDFSSAFILLLVPHPPNGCVFFCCRCCCCYYMCSNQTSLFICISNIASNVFWSITDFLKKKKTPLIAICLFGLVCDLCNFPYPSRSRPKVIVCQQISNVPRIKWLNPRGQSESERHTHTRRERETHANANITNKVKTTKAPNQKQRKNFYQFHQ